MRTSTAYFAGVGTVVVAVAAGLGGGYLAANVVSPHEPTVSKLERRMSAEPIPVTTAPSEPVPYVAATMAAATNPVAAPSQPQPQTEAAAPSANAPAQENTANNTAPAQPAQPAPPPAKSAEQASERTAPQDAFAKTRDADIKRAAVEKRRAERRQRWEDKRRFRQPREQELEAVEERVREVTEPRQVFAFEPERNEMPRIRLFDLD